MFVVGFDFPDLVFSWDFVCPYRLLILFGLFVPLLTLGVGCEF